MELPKTEQELQAIIDSAVKQATDEIVSKHNGEMATLRTRHSAELDKVRKEANMSAEELAKQKASELAEQQAQELSDLRNFKKQTILKEKLANSNLPSYFVNDMEASFGWLVIKRSKKSPSILSRSANKSAKS